jgi:hypothetical protein
MINTLLEPSELLHPVFDVFHQQYIKTYHELELQLQHLADQGSIRSFEVEIILDILTSEVASKIDLKRVNRWIGPHLKVDL